MFVNCNEPSYTGCKNSKFLIYLFFLLYFLLAGKSRFGSLLSMGNTPKTDKLFMKGPGGRGEVEVAVSGVAG